MHQQLTGALQAPGHPGCSGYAEGSAGRHFAGNAGSGNGRKLGYSKYDYQNKDTDDSRNGYSKKTVTSSLGPIDLDIPRDRKGEFEPQIVKKNQTDISNIEDQVLSVSAHLI